MLEVVPPSGRERFWKVTVEVGSWKGCFNHKAMLVIEFEDLASWID